MLLSCFTPSDRTNERTWGCTRRIQKSQLKSSKTPLLTYTHRHIPTAPRRGECYFFEHGRTEAKPRISKVFSAVVTLGVLSLRVEEFNVFITILQCDLGERQWLRHTKQLTHTVWYITQKQASHLEADMRRYRTRDWLIIWAGISTHKESHDKYTCYHCIRTFLFSEYSFAIWLPVNRSYARDPSSNRIERHARWETTHECCAILSRRQVTCTFT